VGIPPNQCRGERPTPQIGVERLGWVDIEGRTLVRSENVVDTSLANKVAWITGGGEGIGRAVALLAAREGARVAVTDHDQESLDDCVAEIERAGGTALAAAADVSQPDAMQRAVASIVEKWGRLDFACANAGTNGTWAPVDELDPRDWNETLAVNLTGTFLTAHFAVPHLRRAGGGSMVFVSSVNGTRVFSNAGASAYAASKAGQLALGKMLALELAKDRIRVNVVCPGAIGTGIHDKTEKQHLDEIEEPAEFPEGRIPLTDGEMGRPEQVAQLVVFLAGDAASHITGTPVWIDGGESLLQG
jgi:NAD(P)-dependent dehydrogenase (short-subunit alcohol dehydrogenase family)